MLEFMLAPENLPFSVALLVMLMIGALEAFGLGAAAAHFDVDADVHADGGDLLGWLGFGKVPFLILIVVLLVLFGMIGLALQQVVTALAGVPLAPWNASAIAFVASLPLLGVSARALGRILPHDETTAVSLDTLLGKRATVTVGTARRGSPAQARVRDIHGQSHYVMIEPHDDAHSVSEGETVLLVRREANIFIGLFEGDALLSRLDERPALTR
jgi:membrane protein implicated in regulation of membrane protease activity